MIPDEPVVEVHTQPEIPAEVAEAAAAAAVAEAEAAVSIAKVQAEAAVEIAEVEEAGATERAAVHAEETAAVLGAVSREEFDECRRNLETLSTQQAATLSTLQALEQRLSPPNPPETLENSGSEKTESPGEAAEEKAPEPDRPKKSAVRWT